MAKFAHLSDEEVLALFKKKLPYYRRMLGKLTSLLKGFFGGVFSAFATNIIDVSGNGGDSAGSLKVTGFKAPSEKELNKYLDTLEMVDELDSLQEMYGRISKSKDAEIKKQAAPCKQILDALNAVYNKTLKALTDTAEKSIPDNVGNLFIAASKALEDFDVTDAEGNAISGASATFVSMGAQAGKGIHFVQILDISDWERESKTPILAVVVTAAMEESGNDYDLRVYVNVHERNVLPFRYNLGKEVKGASLGEIIKQLPKAISSALAIHNVVSVIAPVELAGVDDVEITNILENIEGVEGVSVFENSIEVEIPDENSDAVRSVVLALNTYRPIKKMLASQYTSSFRMIDPGYYQYTITIKGKQSRNANVAETHAPRETAEEVAADKQRILSKVNFQRRSEEVKSMLKNLDGVTKVTIEQDRIILAVSDAGIDEIEDAIVGISSISDLLGDKKNRIAIIAPRDGVYEFTVLRNGKPINLF